MHILLVLYTYIMSPLHNVLPSISFAVVLFGSEILHHHVYMKLLKSWHRLPPSPSLAFLTVAWSVMGYLVTCRCLSVAQLLSWVLKAHQTSNSRPSQGSFNYPFWGDQRLQMNGDFSLIVQEVWVGNLMTPVSSEVNNIFSFTTYNEFVLVVAAFRLTW